MNLVKRAKKKKKEGRYYFEGVATGQYCFEEVGIASAYSQGASI